MPKSIESLGIIPARYASSRFPGKPLVEINGKTMVERVYEQAGKSQLDGVVVATDDDRIFRHVKAAHGRVFMTADFHKSGTDRCAEVAALPVFSEVEIVVNIQGDEPFIHPKQIDLVVSFLKNNPQFDICTLAKKIVSANLLFDPNVVKTVFGNDGRAFYFSRAPIPFVQGKDQEKWLDGVVFYKHIGLYAFRKNTLLALAELPLGRFEEAESLEQLRWLEHGYPIGVVETDLEALSIDTPADLEKLKNKLR